MLANKVALECRRRRPTISADLPETMVISETRPRSRSYQRPYLGARSCQWLARKRMGEGRKGRGNKELDGERKR